MTHQGEQPATDANSGEQAGNARASGDHGRTTDPFKITGPALISFSGGRTSAYMLWRILQAHGGTLPDDVHVCFANTGKEREETLRFVHDCATRWNVPIAWVEFRDERKRTPADQRIDVVGYNSASRAGEPFDRLIARKQSLPSTIRGRWCTQFLKVWSLEQYMLMQGFKSGEYTEVVGFRADEYDRVIELPGKALHEGRRFSFPLAVAGIRKADVLAFWGRQPSNSDCLPQFDLKMSPGYGNCDHCPFLSYKARLARVRFDPAGAAWWKEHEQQRRFAFGRESFTELLRQAHRSPLLPLDEIEADAADSECSAWCGSEAA